MRILNLGIDLSGIYFYDKNNQTIDFSIARGKIINRLFNYLLDLQLLLLWVVGYFPSHFLRRTFYKFSGIQMGAGSTIHMGARFFYPPNISIGQGSILGDHIFLDGRDKLSIGNQVDIASQVLIYNSEHDLSSESMAATTAPVEIGDYVFIGPRAIILPGVKVGRGSVVAAGAVVTKDIPEFTIVGGVPAKEIGKRNLQNPSYKLGRPRLFQ